MQSLLKGFVDTHIHAGPSLIPRDVDAWEMAILAQQGAFRAIVIKDHHVPTMALAKMIEDHLIPWDFQVFGSIALNNSLGGINPKAVEVALGLGARIVWMPTISARNQIERHRGPGIKFPSCEGKKLMVAEQPLSCLDEDGRLSQATLQVLEVMAAHPGAVLATGHLDRNEVDLLVRAAIGAGMDRVVVTHPHFLVGASLKDMHAWRRLGAYLEFTAIISVPSSPIYCRPAKEVGSILKDLGSEQVVLSSDYGIAGAGGPVQGMLEFMKLLADAGLKEADLEMMTVQNPAELLGV